MKLHWKILIWMGLGILVGLGFQLFLDAPAWSGADVDGGGPGALITKLTPGGPAAKAELEVGDRIIGIVQSRGTPEETLVPVGSGEEWEARLTELDFGTVLWVQLVNRDKPVAMTLDMRPDAPRKKWIYWFAFFADIFIQLLKMLIIPLVLTSIICGVAGLGSGKDFGRLGGKTLAYYISTSLLAATLGLILVNLIRPGVGAELPLDPSAEFGTATESWQDIFKRMIPVNIFSAFSDNGQMLSVIFFAILFGFFITRVKDDERKTLLEFFRAAFQVMMKLAGFALALVPYGVFCLMVKVVGETGLAVFKPLAWYMLTVFLGLVLHSCLTLPLILRFVGGINPLQWMRAMSPALMTAFSTSSSSMTLPVTLESVEKRGKVSNKITSFVAPLGATVNMDGTAIYECVGVIFLAQYYFSAMGETLAFGTQLYVVVLALMASIGAAGIPSAGLVMMLTILSALRLPVEGAVLLLAVDRPLDMCRTMVNVWSDSCGSAVIASTEGEAVLVDKPGPEDDAPESLEAALAER